jgi:nicotinamide-nucleotide amidase
MLFSLLAPRPASKTLDALRQLGYILASMKVTVLGIGTELTQGQILNRNGQWISSRMKELGVSSTAHLVVPDDRTLILSALKFCEEHSDIIFVTGGLGPTTDDFTRDLISEWAGKKLLWDENSWSTVQERLKVRNVTVRDSQKQQCFFPEGAKILINRKGTANAFSLQHKNILVFVLPGPPREIDGIWQEFISPEMKDLTAGLDPEITRSWDTIGFGESEVAHLVEKELEGCSFEKGYRVHYPYVEFKLSYRRSQELEAKKWIGRVDQCLLELTALKDGADAAQMLGKKLEQKNAKVLFCDEIEGSLVLQRLIPYAHSLFANKHLEFLVKAPAQIPDDVIFLKLREDASGTAKAEFIWSQKDISRSQIFASPYNAVTMRERERQFFTEKALLFWADNL